MKLCEWIFNPDDMCYETTCKKYLEVDDTTVDISSFLYCPYCGKTIKRIY